MLDCGICRVRLTVVPSRWQPPHRRGISIVEVGEPGVDGRTMLWVPWHALHPGAEESPPAAFLPCTLAAYCFCSAVWQSPHSTRASLAGCGSSLMSAWQDAQSRVAWGDAFRAAALKAGASPALRLPVRAPASWQAAQSSELTFAASCPERPVASARTASAARKDLAGIFTSGRGW